MMHIRYRMQGYRKHIPLFIFTLLNILGQAMQMVVIVLWFATFAVSVQSHVSYSVLVVTAIIYPAAFGILSLIWWCWRQRSGCNWQPLWYDWRTLGIVVVIGFLNALSGLLYFYASDSPRTPAILQPILGGSAVFFSIPLSKWFLKDRKRYLSGLPIGALIIVIVGIVMSLIPEIIQIAHGKDTFTEQLYWPLIYLISFLPMAWYNVLQQYVLNGFAASESLMFSKARDTVGETLYICFYSNLSLCIFMCTLFWFDILPGFGTASSLQEFWTSFVLGFKCGFGAEIPDICVGTVVFTMLYCAGHIISYWSSCRLNEESANYTMLSQVCVSPLVVIFWLVFPHLNPSEEPQPLWSVVPALVLATLGLVLWRVWEVRAVSSQSEGYSPMMVQAYDSDSDIQGRS